MLRCSFPRLHLYHRPCPCIPFSRALIYFHALPLFTSHAHAHRAWCPRSLPSRALTPFPAPNYSPLTTTCTEPGTLIHYPSGVYIPRTRHTYTLTHVHDTHPSQARTPNLVLSHTIYRARVHRAWYQRNITDRTHVHRPRTRTPSVAHTKTISDMHTNYSIYERNEAIAYHSHTRTL